MKSFNRNSQLEAKPQLVSCPVCSKKVLFSSINAHLNTCAETPHSSVPETKTKSVSSLLQGNRKRGPPEDTTVVNIDDEDKKQVGAEEEENVVVHKKIKPDPKIERENEIKYLQKIIHLPLSEKLRPKELKEYVGQQHILSQSKGILYKYIEQNVIPSMILWGPPGVGKTSLARLLTKSATNKYYMIETSATKANTQELRSIFDRAKKEFQLTKRRVILFIDEIHRFNKSQQDLLLPHVENGDIILIGATTENPSFSLNNALISRCHVFVLETLSVNELCIVLSRGTALLNKCRNLILGVKQPLKLSRACLEYIVDVSIGDTRRALNLLEMIEISTRQKGENEEIDVEMVRDIVKSNSSNGLSTYYDPKGDNHYDTISAFHKAVRGSDENASLYYLARMLKGGEDPLYIARRMIRIASEDIGLRDNTLLPLAIAAHNAVMKIGLPEANLALAQCCVALARAPKSVEIYRAWNKVSSMLNENVFSMASSEIPMHIRNAPTKLMEELGYHKGYKYNPDYLDGKVKQEYFPQEVLDKCTDKNALKFLDGRYLGDRIDPDLEEEGT
ncbi:hypothetical protein KAFR_0A07880 [Kazachstania africana CBS 2517]|uniref:UBZ4-type domain-containing protein n=1 Tax=Kazachstania africana (strain ATCC 22294 / BCRC 22015 / CBS 2517 / CECT 1963 / NBRC 1671 / NRRL Y-8276) TaxID=1071382 RepID=H2APC2_KAZAF|nr:hypothetical protein KAFR_0A07880 [Kazachstania africana CBS 2517]CCF56222.1 hypothetical protein KAFR_0A07880 [Kazachstania africana CBS 2517]